MATNNTSVFSLKNFTGKIFPPYFPRMERSAPDRSPNSEKFLAATTDFNDAVCISISETTVGGSRWLRYLMTFRAADTRSLDDTNNFLSLLFCAKRIITEKFVQYKFQRKIIAEVYYFVPGALTTHYEYIFGTKLLAEKLENFRICAPPIRWGHNFYF
jgi:hypothetical protein